MSKLSPSRLDQAIYLGLRGGSGVGWSWVHDFL